MDLIASIGYLATGALYLFLTALLLSVWRGRRLGIYITIVCFASVAWAVGIATGGAYASLRPDVLFLLELARSAAWVSFIAVLVKRLGISKRVAYLPHAIWLSILAFGLVAASAGTIPGTDWGLGQVMLSGGLCMALLALILIEQLYRNSPADSQWHLKPLVLSAGGIFAFDLFVFSQGILFNGIDSIVWVARGWANILFVPLLAVAIRRNPTWDLRIFVSRQVVFYTTTLFAVGIYLLLVSLGGYLILRFGGEWGAIARVVFFVGAGLVLFALLFSGSLRARLRVLLSKHFYQNKYDYREEWRRLVSTLSEAGSTATRKEVIRAAAKIVDSPAGHLWVLDSDSDKYRKVTTFGIDEDAPDIALDDPVVEYVSREAWVIDSDEYDLEPSIYRGLEIDGWLAANKQSWLLVPLISRKDVLGLILLYRPAGAPALNYEDRDLLKMVGNHIAVHVAQEKADRQLSESRQFETYNKMSAFLMHDISNLVAQLSLVVKNAEKHKRNPEFVDDTIETIANSAGRMQQLLGQLKRSAASADHRRTNVLDAVSVAVQNCSGVQPEPGIGSIDEDVFVSVDPKQFEMVLCHLIKNAQDACAEDGKIVVGVQADTETVTISVSDNGSGMSQQYVRDHLFRPFDSTKGSQGMGIGVYQSREFARKLGGDLTAESVAGQGTTMNLSLPREHV